MSEQIVKMDLPSVMYNEYLPYSLYVIIDRALANVYDGLKPVHRRIIYDMLTLGILPDKPYKKSARTVGDVLGKFHPHGDTSVYEAMVILAQSFSTRYPLIDGHGNFGSIDGDPAAAMRYTEARLTKYGAMLLNDINKNTINFVPNYDGEEKEPEVAPNLIPNLLANGTFGIAVGMSSKIPSHRLHDLYEALFYIIECKLESKEIDEDRIIDIIKAPDFPTGGTIIGLEGVRQAYKTGEGKIILRSKYHIEEDDNGSKIIITEIPYQINKEKMVTAIKNSAKDIKDKKGSVIKKAYLQGIKEIIDESDKEGIRIVLYLKKGINPNIVINKLIKSKGTKFQISFNCRFKALVNKVPTMLSLLDILNHFLDHASDVIIRRVKYDLDKAEKRLNLVNGLLRCIDDESLLDEIIKCFRNSNNPIEDLINKFNFNKEQADYIASSRFTSIFKANREKIHNEKNELDGKVFDYKKTLENDECLLLEIKKEFIELDNKFYDERRTSIEESSLCVSDDELIEDETLVVTYTNDNIIKAVEEKEYKSQKRGGKGTKGTNVKDDEIVKFMFTASSKDDLLFFTTEGRCHVIKTYVIGKSSKSAKGRSINNYLNLNEDEKIINVINANVKDTSKFLIMITKNGYIKKLSLEQLSTKFSVTKVISFKDNDSLVQSLLIKEGDNLLILTKNGQSLRINTSATKNHAIRAMGRSAVGVTGITLKNNDNVIDMCPITDDSLILTITEKGLGKFTKGSEWKITGRGGKGVIAHDITDKTGNLISAKPCNIDSELFIATSKGIISRISMDKIRICSRSSKGVKLINLDNDNLVSSISINEKED